MRRFQLPEVSYANVTVPIADLQNGAGVLGDLNGVADFRAAFVNDLNGVEMLINLDGFYSRLL